MDEMINLTDNFLLQLKNKAEQIILANIDSEINYIFTNDEDYLNRRTKLIPRTEKEEPSKLTKANEAPNKKQEKPQQQQQTQRMDSKEER